MCLFQGDENAYLSVAKELISSKTDENGNIKDEDTIMDVCGMAYLAGVDTVRSLTILSFFIKYALIHFNSLHLPSQHSCWPWF